MKKNQFIALLLFCIISLGTGYFLHWLKIEEKHKKIEQSSSQIIIGELDGPDIITEVKIEPTIEEKKGIPEEKAFKDLEEDTKQNTLKNTEVIHPYTQPYVTTDNDSAIDKFVGPSVPFHDLEYIPHDLQSLGEDYILDSKGTAQMRKQAADAFAKLAKAFYDDFQTDIIVVSTYRSYDYQKRIKDRGCPDNLCSKAGHSEHQSGLAIDLWETTTYSLFMAKPKLKEYYAWMMKYAAGYGFHNSYQKGRNIDGYDREPWHWRYVGTDLALKLQSQNITLTEYNNISY